MQLTQDQVRDLPRNLYDSINNIAKGKKPTDLIKRLDENTRILSGTLRSGLEFSTKENCIVVPLNLVGLSRSLYSNVYNAAGALVGDTLQPAEQLLLPSSVCVRAGARLLTNLRSNVSIPKAITNTTLSWRHELDVDVETDPTVGALNLTPHRVCGAVVLTQQADTQTDGALSELLIDGLKRGVGSALDAAALVGSGTAGSPLGAFYATGTNSVTFGAAATRAKSVSFIKQITTSNGDDESISFVGHPATKEKWQTLQTFSGGSATLWEDDNTVAGKPAYVTTSMPSTAIMAGDFTKMVIAVWGGAAEILINPYTHSLSGRIQIVVNLLADTGLLRPEVFTKSADSAVQ